LNFRGCKMIRGFHVEVAPTRPRCQAPWGCPSLPWCFKCCFECVSSVRAVPVPSAPRADPSPARCPVGPVGTRQLRLLCA
jgi:hypothetical protein